MEIGAHIIVEGLVQGVGFRWFIARKAEGLGLRGYAKNLYNGNVEIEVAGERSLVEELIKEVKIGPRSAQVTNLKIEWLQPTDQYTHFEIR
ncbi:MAG: acyP [Bacteroidetes bacterium]|nr:acyP [Bacteroidota bacterium]